MIFDSLHNLVFYDNTDKRFQSINETYQKVINELALSIINDSGFFQLLPKPKVAPTIVNTLKQSFQQFTFPNQSIQYTIEESIDVVANTEFALQLMVEDPSNYMDVFNIENVLFTWYQNNNVIKRGKGYNNSILHILPNECVPSKTGTYRCEVSNLYGTSFSDEFNINVYLLPLVAEFNSNLVVNGNASAGTDEWNNDDSTFITKNFYPLSYQWIKRDQTIGGTTINPNFLFSKGHINSMSETDSRLKRINAVSNDVVNLIAISSSYVGGPYKYTTFYPSPSVEEQKVLDSSEFYFTRDQLVFESSGGNRICEAYQDIDVSPIANFIDGKVYGITNLRGEFKCFIGGGISYYDSNNILGKVEDFTKVYIAFLDEFGIELSDAILLNGPTECDILDATLDFLSFNGCMIIIEVNNLFPLIPQNCKTIRIKIVFEHTGLQQALEVPETFNWFEDYIFRNNMSLGQTSLLDPDNQSEEIKQKLRIDRYGNPRNLITGLSFRLFPIPAQQNIVATNIGTID